eukprot:1357470-Amorphochlora_amoeboformis.AAC.1
MPKIPKISGCPTIVSSDTTRYSAATVRYCLVTRRDVRPCHAPKLSDPVCNPNGVMQTELGGG